MKKAYWNNPVKVKHFKWEEEKTKQQKKKNNSLKIQMVLCKKYKNLYNFCQK